ncbi:MAG: hypothetical protein M3Q10_08460, partial [Chloroflexota bacterium]|nr:hypothetical protein [Chloroflexota bacterium]
MNLPHSPTAAGPLTIASVEVIPVRLPLREPFVVAYATITHVESVLVRLRTAGGAEGWGEATPDPNVTGETFRGTAATLRHDLAPALLGRDARDRDAALGALEPVMDFATGSVRSTPIHRRSWRRISFRSPSEPRGLRAGPSS